MKLRLIEEWRQCWRMFSVQAMALATAIQGAWMFIPPQLQASIPPGWVKGITISLLVLGILGRLVDQPKVQP